MPQVTAKAAALYALNKWSQSWDSHNTRTEGDDFLLEHEHTVRALLQPAVDECEGRIEGAYKRYPDLELHEIEPLEVAKMYEMAVLLNTEYTQKSFVHKMLLQGAFTIRNLFKASRPDAGGKNGA